jgi:hypothetical protein
MQKLVVIVLFAVGGIAGLFGLNYIRKERWSDTHVSTQAQGRTLTEDDLLNEAKIEEMAKNDQSTLDRDLDIRYIKSLPKNMIELESAYRQRKMDSCEVIPAKEPLELKNWTNVLSKRDTKRAQINPLDLTRRTVISVGLKISESDKESLPLLSRSTIAEFLLENYLSLQARIIKEPKSGKWILHHRPLAAVAKFRSVPLAQEFVDPVGQTTGEIRGLGILRPSLEVVEAAPQTAVWLFRSTWQKAGEPFDSTHFEYAFVHAIPQNVLYTHDQLALHTIVTSEQRTKFHYLRFRKEGKREPQSASETDLVGTVHFTEFANDGLHPKQTVTRAGQVRDDRSYSLGDIEAFLNEKGLTGGWEQHITAVLDAIVHNQLAKARETTP